MMLIITEESRASTGMATHFWTTRNPLFCCFILFFFNADITNTRAVWAFIHSKTSKLDFDSVAYGKQRLEEYYTWKREYDGSRVNAGEEIPFREQRWAREE